VIWGHGRSDRPAARGAELGHLVGKSVKTTTISLT